MERENIVLTFAIPRLWAKISDFGVTLALGLFCESLARLPHQLWGGTDDPSWCWEVKKKKKKAHPNPAPDCRRGRVWQASPQASSCCAFPCFRPSLRHRESAADASLLMGFPSVYPLLNYQDFLRQQSFSWTLPLQQMLNVPHKPTRSFSSYLKQKLPSQLQRHCLNKFRYV